MMSELGTGALEDGIFVREDWIADEANQDIATRFLKASLQRLDLLPRQPGRLRPVRARRGPDARRGPPALADERDQQADLAERERDRDHERGRLRHDGADRDQDYDIVKNDPGDGVFTTEFAEAAVAELEDDGVDVNGADWEAPEVEVTEGGE